MLTDTLLTMICEANTHGAKKLILSAKAIDLYDFLADNGCEPYGLPPGTLTPDFLRGLSLDFVDKHGGGAFLEWWEGTE